MNFRTHIAPALIGLLILAGCQAGGSKGGPGVGASELGSISLEEIRASAGLPALRQDAKLERAAAQQAGYMAAAGKMSHNVGWRKDFASRMRENGIEGAAAENVAHGAMSTGKLFAMWNDSPPHRRNILDPRFGRYGLGSAEDGQGRKYWALVLGR